MIEIDRNIRIDSSCIKDKDNAEISLLNIYKKESDTINNEKGKIKGIEVKNNERVRINIKIENTSDISFKNLSLIINDDNVFKFVHSSLRNCTTKEMYIPVSEGSNTFELGQIAKNQSMKVSFFVKIDTTKLNVAKIGYGAHLMSQENEEKDDVLIHASQSILMVNKNIRKNMIEIENVGSAVSNNIVYRYNVPRGFNVDMSSIKYDVTNEKCNIHAQKIDRNILFTIDKILPSSKNDAKKIKINLKHVPIDTNLQNMELKIK